MPNSAPVRESIDLDDKYRSTVYKNWYQVVIQSGL